MKIIEQFPIAMGVRVARVWSSKNGVDAFKKKKEKKRYWYVLCGAYTYSRTPSTNAQWFRFASVVFTKHHNPPVPSSIDVAYGHLSL